MHKCLSAQFYKVICRNGMEHFAELCVECGKNIRGPGVWVPKSQVSCPDKVPILKDNSSKDTEKQPSLWDAQNS